MEKTGLYTHRKEEENNGIGKGYSVDTAASLQRPLNEGRELTSKDAGLLLAQAEKLQSLEGALVSDEMTRKLTDAAVEDKISVADTYKIARDMGIKTEYVDRLLSLYFPSTEQMEEDLQGLNAVLSSTVWVAKMRALYSWIVPTLRKTFPFSEFGIETLCSGRDEIYRYDQEKQEYTTLFLRKKKTITFTKKVQVLEIDYRVNPQTCIAFKLLHPSFLRACCEDFKKTNERARKLGISVDIERDYVV